MDFGDGPTVYDAEYLYDGEVSMFESTEDMLDAGNFGAALAPSPSANTPLTGYISPAKLALSSSDNTALSQPNSTLHPRSAQSSASPESSSQDSSSESSRRNKRKLLSGSPLSTNNGASNTQNSGPWMKSKSHASSNPFRNPSNDSGLGFGFGEGSAADMLSLEKNMEDISVLGKNNFFDFDRAGVSPAAFGALDTIYAAPRGFPTSIAEDRGASISTVRPPRRQATFNLNESREESPSSATVPSHQPSPITYQSPPSNNGDAYDGGWAGSNSNWKSDFSPSLMDLSPPVVSGNSPYTLHATECEHLPAKLHIHPFQSKSRVETQIHLKMTLYPIPPGIAKLHLPTNSISKPKFLAKEVKPSRDTLELETMLVCTSAMENEELRRQAFARARGVAMPDKKPTPRRASTTSTKGSEDDDDPDRPLNGGPVTVCENCINRERKRAARKKAKKEENEETWFTYERERVIVFNTNEYKDWKPPTPHKDPTLEHSMTFPDTAMQIDAPMRIACYCRHHQEKLGFKVVFTVKDFEGRVVAQDMTQSILITDDHKTNKDSLDAQQSMSYVDLSQAGMHGLYMADQEDARARFQHHRPYHSTNDLTALRGGPSGAMFNPADYSQLPNMISQSTCVTPLSRSRQASPTAQIGPNKKRKGSSTHRIPRGLAMTRADAQDVPMSIVTSMSGPSNMASTSAVSPFSPTTPFSMGDASITTPPTSMPGQYFAGLPNTQGGSGFTSGIASASFENLNSQYYSAPSSAHPSRAPSPTMQSRRYANGFTQDEHGFANPLGNPQTSVRFRDMGQPQQRIPQVIKILPPEGPLNGGIEVTILGNNLTKDMDVVFGDISATTTTWWNEKTIVCLLPPSSVAGPVLVSLQTAAAQGHSPHYPIATDKFFTYIDDQEQQVYQLAFRLLYEKRVDPSAGDIRAAAQNIIANAQQGQWSSRMGQSQHPGMQGRQVMGLEDAMPEGRNTEEVLLRCLETIDMDDSPREADFEMKLSNGATLLSLACSLGYTRVVAGLLARKAHPDTPTTGGFTPLMIAAMHGRAAIVRRLLVKGADPTMRSYRGYTATNLASSREVLQELQRIQPRVRADSTGTPTFRSRANSFVSNWEMPSPSQSSGVTSEDDNCEGGDDDNEVFEPIVTPAAWAASRRSSAVHLRSRRNSAVLHGQGALSLQEPPPDDQFNPFSAASMAVWRDSLAAQINSFQQNMNFNFPNFQLPALPPMPTLPDNHAQAMVRRISSLVPQRMPSRSGCPSDESAVPNTVGDSSWRDWFTTQASSTQAVTAPPPAYDEIYPDRAEPSAEKKLPELTAIMEAALDQQAFETYDTGKAEVSSLASRAKSFLQNFPATSVTEPTRGQQPERIPFSEDHAAHFIWIPMLLVLIGFMIHVYAPQHFSVFSKIAAYLPHQEGF